MFRNVIVIATSLVLSAGNCFSQTLAIRLNGVLQNLSADEQFKHAVISLYVIDGKTGKLIFERNAQLGLAPASCQKVITSVSAFEMLGKEFQYKTYIEHDGTIDNGTLKGNLYFTGSGDPTFGSGRWYSTSEPMVLKKIADCLHKNKISSVAGDLVCDDARFTSDPLPGGWVWEDIGNYYGAGAWGFNWLENQFDVTFKTSNKLHGNTEIISTKPSSILKDYKFTNFVTTGTAGSGDNGYLFSSPFHKNIIARGTVPMSDNGFTISGSIPDPPSAFTRRVEEYLSENGCKVSGKTWTSSQQTLNGRPVVSLAMRLDSILSPPLDSINYWFLKKSVNLFGEALIKTIAQEKTGIASTDTGVALVKDFWSNRGVEKAALKMIDGSGLSPANRVTTYSLVTVLQYARARPWFSSFYNALPETNGIKMKDGYITGVRSYTGYIKCSNGQEYTFAFIVNNFDGSAATAREKMWKVLDVLKVGK